MTSFGGPTYPVRVMVEDWIAKMGDRSNARIVFEYYPGDSLYKNKDAFDPTSENVIQMCVSSFGYFPEKVDNALADIQGMPFNWDFDKFYQHYRDKGSVYDTVDGAVEKLNLKLVAWGANKGVEFASTTPLRKPADFKGKMMRIGSGPKRDALGLLGATPVSMASEDVVTALQRKTIDAGIISIGIIVSNKWYEVAPYITIANWICGSVQIFMNRDFYNSLPPELQKLSDDTWIEAEKTFSEEFGRTYKEEVDFLKKQPGVDVYVLSAEETAQWKKLMQPLFVKYEEKWGDKWAPAMAAVDLLNK
ncbi:TRAP transporter substrate-binding protein [Chloroflexota bacterium]